MAGLAARGEGVALRPPIGVSERLLCSLRVPEPRFGDRYFGRGARIARRDDRGYGVYPRKEQRREAGCPARNVSANFGSGIRDAHRQSAAERRREPAGGRHVGGREPRPSGGPRHAHPDRARCRAAVGGVRGIGGLPGVPSGGLHEVAGLAPHPDDAPDRRGDRARRLLGPRHAHGAWPRLHVRPDQWDADGDAAGGRSTGGDLPGGLHPGIEALPGLSLDVAGWRRMYVLPVFWHVASGRWLDWKETTPIPDGAHDMKQIWNVNCFNCHATNLDRGYQPAVAAYRTQWTELGIGCEACHGPGRDHIALTEGWARDPATMPRYSSRASNRQLSETLGSSRHARPIRAAPSTAAPTATATSATSSRPSAPGSATRIMPCRRCSVSRCRSSIPRVTSGLTAAPTASIVRRRSPCRVASRPARSPARTATWRTARRTYFSLRVNVHDGRSGDQLCTQCHQSPPAGPIDGAGIAASTVRPRVSQPPCRRPRQPDPVDRRAESPPTRSTAPARRAAAA